MRRNTHTLLIYNYMADFGGGSAFGSIVQPFLEHVFNTQYQDSAQSFARNEAQKAFERERNFALDMQSRGTSLKMSDLRRAGLSPAFLNGAMLATNPMAAHSSAPVLPAQRAPSMNLAEGMLMEAQARNLNADADNKDADTVSKKINNSYLDALNKSEIALRGSQIDLNGSHIDLNDAEKEQIAQSIAESENRIAKMVGEMNIMRKQVDIMSHEEKIKAIEAAYKSSELQAQIAALSASANLSQTQAEDIVKTQLYRIMGLESTSMRDKSMANLMHWNAQDSKLQFNLNSTFSKAERIIGLIDKGADAFNGSVDALTNVLTKGASSFAKNAAKATKANAKNDTATKRAFYRKHGFIPH